MKDLTEEANKVKDVVYVNDIKDRLIDSFRNGYQTGQTTHFGGFDKHWTWFNKDVSLFGGIVTNRRHPLKNIMVNTVLCTAVNT